MGDTIIETERLVLRPLTVADAEAMYEWVSDERVARYMAYPTYTDIGPLKAYLASVEKEPEPYVFGFVRKEDGKLIGSGDVSPDEMGDGWWGFGYNLRYDCWGQGYATEATKALIRYAHERYGACKFTSNHATPNTASGHVMEKCGLHFDHYSEFEKLDGSCKFESMVYVGELF